MGLISDKDREQISKMFAAMTNDVKLLFFTEEGNTECMYCDDTGNITREVAGLSDKIHFVQYDLKKDAAVAMKYNINQVPAIVLLGKDDKDYGIRFFGIPSGYEFGTLIEDIIDVSKGSTGLSAKTKELLSQITKDVHVQVFITPT